MKPSLVVLCLLVLLGQGFAHNKKGQVLPDLESIVNPSNMPVLLVFFSIACPYCYDELFEMKSWIERQPIDVLLVGVACESAAGLEGFLDKYSFSYPVINDVKMKIHRKLKAHSPYKIVLVNGQVAYRDDNREDIPTRREKAKAWLTSRFFRSHGC